MIKSRKVLLKYEARKKRNNGEERERGKKTEEKISLKEIRREKLLLIKY
jgi:hypothetical protein